MLYIRPPMSLSLEDTYENLHQYVSFTYFMLVNLGSLVFNGWLIYCLDNELDLPDLKDQSFYCQFLRIGCERTTEEDEEEEVILQWSVEN